jgi:4-hydroxy-tetrahydrodipicolinate reductase
MREHTRLRVLHYGLGEIGIGIARESAATGRLDSVGAVDVDPEKIGKPLASLWGARGGATVRGTLSAALADAGKVDVAFHCAGSHIDGIESQLLELIDAGCNVVTTAEEVIWPWGNRDDAARRLDAAARKKGVTLFAAGVNPGFLLDRLPTYLSSMTLGPTAVRGTRLVDLSKRRNALRRKMGVGQDAASVRERTSRFAMGHAGFPESVRYLAAALGWSVGEVVQSLEPVVADKKVERAGEVVLPGQVLGLAHTARAVAPDGKEISFSLTMRLDCEEPFDQIEIDGRPPIVVRFPIGVQGDLATLASAVNACSLAMDSEPGLVCRLATPIAL